MPARSPAPLLLAVALALLPGVARAELVSAEWATKWRADLAFAADSLPRAHPNFFHTVSRATYRAALDSLAARVPRLAHHEIVVELARIVALVGDGHTRLTLPFDPAAGFFTGHSTTAAPRIPGLIFRHYPIRLGLFADTLWVIRADSAHRDLLGARVVRLGSRSAAEAMAAVEPTIQRDNPSQVRDLMPTWLVCPEILNARGVMADMERATIEVERPGGAILKRDLAPIAIGTAGRWQEARDPGTPPLRDRFPERRHWFERLAGTGTFYARYREVMDDPNESIAQFADTLFAAMEAARADRLVLDLRGNVGGDGSLNRPLLLHLIRAERLWQPAGLWALIDRGTFSAAVMLAAQLESQTPTVFVGEMTGGDPNSYGDSRRHVLPNSGLTARISSLYWQLTDPRDKRHGITPHVPAELHFAEWRANRDPALEVALARGGRDTGVTGAWSGTMGWTMHRLPLRLDVQKAGTELGARVNLPAVRLTDVAVAGARRSDDVLDLHWSVEGRAWGLRARRAGERLIGLMRYEAVDYPVVLSRTAVTASSERPASSAAP